MVLVAYSPFSSITQDMMRVLMTESVPYGARPLRTMTVTYNGGCVHSPMVMICMAAMRWLSSTFSGGTQKDVSPV